ncbi:MAG: efflux RND transporter periplasmic adaptor subunit [Sphingorhabdus sp.]|jgi:HlyD family secretion protein|uniref:efflux RND transporter periplasmic adaptor subunit n=1 Tax=Sphingorhabdus sp. TaxID=1902408 RepID=UPI00273D9C68|nr:efflux RND transporter periplasmic adaptor subunit [Sphingorhabdus sp.]MDP4757113.1 efflux RND transporter periplasmic adaptor subunit [Sphingorhabdus sp.]MDP4874304.1 efflux RND transporter periplasmic adaptor subunit [Sphingorhabdus sp.]MDP4926043.1 efflux RND transporter periplasmic adaptor subunit [Sphingorhabdus sp.]
MNYETTMSGALNDEMQDDNADRNRRRIIIAAVIAAILIVAGGAYYFFGKSNDPVASAEAEKAAQAQTVSVVVPGRDTVARTINATGTLAARREIPVGVVGEGGRVLQVYADAGDWVSQGDILVSVDRSVQAQQAAALEAQIGVTRADLQLAQNELDRAMQLVARGFISKADVDRKTATRDATRARVNVANAQLAETRARNARLDIRAPVSGYVLERNVETGQTVSAGSSILFRIAKDGQLELQTKLSEDDLAQVDVGIPATVTPVGTDRVFSGNIWQISPMIDAQSRQGMARVALPFDKALRPGGFASVEIKSGAMTAPVLPESAVQTGPNGSFVYVVGKDNKVKQRPVKVGPVTANGLIIEEGLDGTERVVLYAGGFLNPDETINPKLLKKQ